MLVELTIVPVGNDTHTSAQLAEALKLIDASGLSYQLTPAGTCIEGRWEEVMPLIERCHRRVRQMAPHVVTTIRIEDKSDGQDMLRRNVESVKEKMGSQEPMLAG